MCLAYHKTTESPSVLLYSAVVKPGVNLRPAFFGAAFICTKQKSPTFVGDLHDSFILEIHMILVLYGSSVISSFFVMVIAASTVCVAKT